MVKIYRKRVDLLTDGFELRIIDVPTNIVLQEKAWAFAAPCPYQANSKLAEYRFPPSDERYGAC